MSYVNETLKRANMQALRKYLMYGDKVDEQAGSYEERLKQSYDDCLQMVQKYDSKGEDSELFRAINNLTAERENAYMEIGIQAGFSLAKDILKGDITEENAVAKYKEMYISLFEDISNAVEGLKKAQQKAEEIYISL